MIDIKVVYLSDAFSLVKGPSSAIAHLQHSGQWSPTHGISPYRGESAANAGAAVSIQALACAGSCLWPWQAQQKPLTSRLPASRRIKFNADGNRPRADD
jgi:hypothetical protein